MLLTNPHRWPGLRIVDGPAVGGLGVGDVCAVDPPRELRLTPAGHAPPLPWRLDLGRRAPALPFPRPDRDVDDDDEEGEDDALPLRLLVDDGWTLNGRPVAAGDVFDAGPWRVALVDDAGVVPAVSVADDGGVFGRPVAVLPVDDAWGAIWLDLRDPGFFAVRVDGRVRARFRRESAVPLDHLRRSQTLGGVVDAGVAKAIAVGADGCVPDVDLGFDGAVCALADPRRGFTALEHFSRLIGQPLTWERDRPAAQARFDAVEAASVDDVAALARALDPVGWQREQQLREECALAVAVHGAKVSS